MKLLITGADGQLGQALARACAENKLPVIALNRHQLDITDACAIAMQFRHHQPTVVINTAAYNAVDQAEIDSTQAFAINATGPKLLAQACAQQGVRLIHISSDYVFSGDKQTPYSPADDVSPLNQYGASKLAGERAISAELSEHIIVRTSWLYSEYGNNFAKTILKLAKTEPELKVVSDQRGSPTYAPNLAAIILQVVAKISQPDWQCFGTYHYAGNEELSWFEFARIIIHEYALHSGITRNIQAISTEQYPRLAIRPNYSVLASDNLLHDFAIELKTTSNKSAIKRLLKG